MTTAQDRLNAIMPSWHELLTQWSLDGSLASTAVHVLDLDGENAKKNAKGKLQSLVSQWSAGNFKSLPEIVLLSHEDISGAQGAYAESTDTIYLSDAFLEKAAEEAIHDALTHELGHFLDAQLNEADTQGEEGDAFARVLSGEGLAAVTPSGGNSLNSVTLPFGQVEVENFSTSEYRLSFQNLAKRATGKEYMVETNEVATSQDGSIYVLGNFTETSIDYGFDFQPLLGFLSKFSASGELLWSEILPTLTSLQCISGGSSSPLHVGTSTVLVAAGSSAEAGGFLPKIYEYSFEGNLERTIDIPSKGGADQVISITRDSRGNTFAITYNSPGNFSLDKISSSTEPSWSIALNGNAYQEVYVDANDNLILGGTSRGSSSYYGQILHVDNLSGEQKIAYQQSSVGAINCIDVNSVGYVAFAGWINNSLPRVGLLSPNGSLMWEMNLPYGDGPRFAVGDVAIMDDLTVAVSSISGNALFSAQGELIWSSISSISSPAPYTVSPGTNGELAMLYRSGDDIGIQRLEGPLNSFPTQLSLLQIPTQDLAFGVSSDDLSNIAVSGDLNISIVEPYEITKETARNKSERKTTITFSDPLEVSGEGPFDAFFVNGGLGDNTINAQGLLDPNDGSVLRSGFDAAGGGLVLNGMEGADSLFSAVSGSTWMIGGGVSQPDTFDVLTGHLDSRDYFDLRRESSEGIWDDAYEAGFAILKDFDPANDTIVLSGLGDGSKYRIDRVVNTQAKGKGKKVISSETLFKIYDVSQPGLEPNLIAEVYGSGFSGDTQLSILYGQDSQGPLDILFPGQSTSTVV